MPGRGSGMGRGGGRGGGGGQGRGRGRGSGGDSNWVDLAGSALDIGRRLIDRNKAGIMPVGEPVEVKPPESRKPVESITQERQVQEKALSPRAEINLIKQEVAEMIKQLKDILNRVKELEEKL